MEEIVEHLKPLLDKISGYIYPNEIELHWGLLVVIYPYITGLVAGAFILASLVKVFNVKELQPTYRMSLLTALAFLLVAPLPLLAHLGHPERAFEIFLPPNASSAMAMFGFVSAYPVGVSVARVRRVYFRFRQGEPVVVERAEADRVSVFGDRVGSRHGAAHLYDSDTPAR